MNVRAALLIKRMIAFPIDINKSKILIVGVGKVIDGEYQYETDVLDLVEELQEYKRLVHVFDRDADTEFLKTYYNIHCENDMSGFGKVSTYSAIVMAFSQKDFDIHEHLRGRCIVLDYEKI